VRTLRAVQVLDEDHDGANRPWQPIPVRTPDRATGPCSSLSASGSGRAAGLRSAGAFPLPDQPASGLNEKVPTPARDRTGWPGPDDPATTAHIENETVSEHPGDALNVHCATTTLVIVIAPLYYSRGFSVRGLAAAQRDALTAGLGYVELPSDLAAAGYTVPVAASGWAGVAGPC